MRLHKFAFLPSSHKMQKVFTTPARSTCSALNIFFESGLIIKWFASRCFFAHTCQYVGHGCAAVLAPIYLRTCFYLGEFLEWGGVGGARARKYCTPSEASVGGSQFSEAIVGGRGAPCGGGRRNLLL